MRVSLSGLSAIWLATTAGAEPPRVVADIAPVHSLVAQVMDGVAEPVLLVDPGASPHDYALRPSQAAALDKAGLVVWMGEGLTPWLVGSLDTLAVNASRLELIEEPGAVRLAFREGATFDDHGGHDHDDHDDHEGIDPHAWLDPVNAQLWLGAIARELSRVDPENAERYATNAHRAQADLDGLIAEMQAMLAPMQGSSFIVFHDAFHYLEARFGLSAAGAISLGDAADPGAARVAQVRQAVVDRGVACVFTEPQFNPGLLRAVAENGVKVIEIDPLGAGLPTGPQLYSQMMRALARGISECR